MAIEGKLTDMSLPSLLQMICLEERNATLVLEHRGQEGAIYIDGGEITHATLGRLVGEEAVFNLLSWDEGAFHIRNSMTIPRRTVAVPWNHLVMEGMRRIDEVRVQEGSRKRDHGLLSPRELEADRVFEMDLIGLMSNFEYLRAKLSDERTMNRPIQALEILRDMVNHSQSFTEDSMISGGKDFLTTAVAELGNGSPPTQLGQVNDNRLSDHLVLQCRDWTGSPTSRQETFDQVALILVSLLEAYFSFLIKNFRAPLLLDQWIETTQVFIADLRRAVEEIAF